MAIQCPKNAIQIPQHDLQGSKRLPTLTDLAHYLFNRNLTNIS